jgi:hypothetical protein
VDIKRGIAALVTAGAAITGTVVLSSPASALTGHFYQRFSGTNVLSSVACNEVGAGLYHTQTRFGYVQSWDCYLAGSGIDLEVYT